MSKIVGSIVPPCNKDITPEQLAKIFADDIRRKDINPIGAVIIYFEEAPDGERKMGIYRSNIDKENEVFLYMKCVHNAFGGWSE